MKEELLKSLEEEKVRLRKAEAEYEALQSQAHYWVRNIRKKREAVEDKIQAIRFGQLSFEEFCAGQGRAI